MNFTTQRAKNLISKDAELSKKTASEILNNCDIETFKTLCDNSSHIFDFIIDKIVKNLTNATNHENIKTTFEFAKIYNERLGDFIVKSWLRLANEDLTDELLEIFENGTLDQKIYTARYFEKINDPPALDLLNKYAYSENEYLSQACACALSSFGDNTLRNQVIESLKDKNDDFKRYFSLKFLINYGKNEDLPIIIAETLCSPFGANLAADILYKYSLDELCNLTTFEDSLGVFDEIVSAYPEDIPLDTICDFNIYDFLNKLFENKNEPFVNRILADLKNIFELICEGNIYTYDLNKDSLLEIKNINNRLKAFNPDENLITQELEKTPKRILRALNTLSSIATDTSAQKIKILCEKTDNSAVLCECAKIAKILNRQDMIKKEEILKKIAGENARALFESYFN